MIYFLIPLRSKAASKNWEEVSRVFNRTLASVYNQTDPDFRIFVACHDIPSLEKTYDARVEFIQAETPVPTTPHEMMLDKGYKISLMAQRLRLLGGGYTMLVDSDDLVSNRIAAFVKQHPNRNGFLSKYGYVYNEGLPYMKKVYKLHRICGSCSIVNYRTEDLPEDLPKDLWDLKPFEKYVIRKSHRYIPDYLENNGRKLDTCPFITTVYVRNTGDNHSMLNGHDLNEKRKLELLLRRRITIGKNIQNEFFGGNEKK